MGCVASLVSILQWDLETAPNLHHGMAKAHHLFCLCAEKGLQETAGF